MAKFNRNTPYNSLPLLPPKTTLETTKVLRKAIISEKVGKEKLYLNHRLMAVLEAS